MKYLRYAVLAAMFGLAACTTTKPPVTLSSGETLGDYHIVQFSFVPTETLKNKTLGTAVGTVEEIEEFQKNSLPYLQRDTAAYTGGKAVDMVAEVVLINNDINKIKAMLVSDQIRVVTNVTLYDHDTHKVVAKGKVGAMAENTLGLFGVISDAATAPTHEQYQQILSQKYSQAFVQRFFPAPK